MKIRREPSGRNAYWYETIGEHQVLHFGCFNEDLERSLRIYAQLLNRLRLCDSSLWLEFQSTKRWWFNERSRDKKLSWKPAIYYDESYMAYDLVGQTEVLDALKRFWLLKELRFYFWSRSGALDARNVISGVSRTEFRDIGRYVPGVIRFVAAREVCRSYIRIMFHNAEAGCLQKAFADFIAMCGLDLQLEASVFRE